MNKFGCKLAELYAKNGEGVYEMLALYKEKNTFQFRGNTQLLEFTLTCTAAMEGPEAHFLFRGHYQFSQHCSLTF